MYIILALFLFISAIKTLKPDATASPSVSHDTHSCLDPWLSEDHSATDDTTLLNQIEASQLTLYPWIFEVETKKSENSRLCKLKERLGKFGSRVLRPFQVLKSCMKGSDTEN